MKIFVIKQSSGLRPAYDSDHEALSKYDNGDELEAVIKKPRNITPIYNQKTRHIYGNGQFKNFFCLFFIHALLYIII